ncbi:nucleotide exchange factor GrpE [Candidatus Bathyarchaeota archaeon]|nr:nucleotide exchange factor GrpE [Candidatus Bathyarchaeota archaeon]
MSTSPMSEDTNAEAQPLALPAGEEKERKGKVSKEQLKREIEALKKELCNEQERAEKYLTQLKYLQADFENFQKRIQKEIDQKIQQSNERLIVNLLSVIDELELAVQAGKRTKNSDVIVSGVEMVLKKLYETLGQEGLVRIEAVGKPFDPVKHEAVQKVITNEYADGTIIEEIRKGFVLRDKVIRPSMVKVALAPNASEGVHVESGGEPR